MFFFFSEFDVMTEIDSTTPMITGEIFLESFGDKVYRSGLDRTLPNIKKLDTGIKENLISRFFKKKKIDRVGLAKILGVKYQAIDQWYKSPHTSISSLRKVYAKEEFGLNWKATGVYDGIFPHFNLITESHENAKSWFRYFYKNGLKSKYEDEHEIAVIALLENIDKLIKWELPVNPSDLNQQKYLRRFFDVFFSCLKDYFPRENQALTIRDYEQNLLITSAIVFEKFDEFESPTSLESTFDFYKLSELVKLNKKRTKSIIKQPNFPAISNFQKFDEYISRFSVSGNRIAWRGEINERSHISLKLASIENKLDQLLDAISVLNTKKENE